MIKQSDDEWKVGFSLSVNGENLFEGAVHITRSQIQAAANTAIRIVLDALTIYLWYQLQHILHTLVQCCG
jgi:predicted AlkP superfamily pyrophosphatase or phosphodiesterase